MLTEEEKHEIEAEMPNYAEKKAVGIDALRIVQRHRGWVTDEAIHDVAGLLDMTQDELDAVATFYNMIFREPVGKHVILACDSISCWIMGYEHVRDQRMKQLGIGMGETTPDGHLTLVPIVCLGTCDHAPAMMVDNDTYGDLSPEKVGEILEKYQ